VTVTLVRPEVDHLASYRSALERGWSPDNVDGPATRAAQLAAIAAEPQAFLAGLEMRDPAGARIRLPDGSEVPRLPGFVRWIWDGAVAGSIGLRWQPGTSELPAHVLGHVGFAVVPWRRRRGYATRALALLLPLARAEGLAWVELTTDPDNLASQRVIEANGGTLTRSFRKAPAYGGGTALRYRIML
jgi:predicted acetyltransferase